MPRTQALLSSPKSLPCRLITHSDRTQQEITVSADVFCQGLKRDVHPVNEGIEVDACRPGVVDRNQGAMRVCGLCDRRHILHLHRDGAGAFAPDQTRIRLEMCANPFADRRVVVAVLNTKSAQQSIGQLTVRPVDTFRDKDVLASFEERKVHQ